MVEIGSARDAAGPTHPSQQLLGAMQRVTALATPPTFSHPPTCKHGQLANVWKAAQAGAVESAPHISHKDLGTLVEEQLAAAADLGEGATHG